MSQLEMHQATLYETAEAGVPPMLAGADHARVTCALPATALSSCATEGRPSGDATIDAAGFPFAPAIWKALIGVIRNE